MLPTNDLSARADRIARQFKTADLFRIAARLVEIAGAELDGAVDENGDELDLTLETGEAFDKLEALAEQADKARDPVDPREWDMSRSFAQLGLVRRVGA